MVPNHDPFHPLIDNLTTHRPLWASTIGLMAHCPNYALLTRMHPTIKTLSSNHNLVSGAFLHRAFHTWNQAWISDIWDDGPQTHESVSKVLTLQLEQILEEFDTEAEGPKDFLASLKKDIHQLLSFFSRRILRVFHNESDLIDGQILVHQVFHGEPHFEERLAIYQDQIVACPDVYARRYDEACGDSTTTELSVIEVKKSDWAPAAINIQAVTTAMVAETSFQAPIQSVHVVLPKRIRSVSYSKSAKTRVLRLAKSFLAMDHLDSELCGRPLCNSCILQKDCQKLVSQDDTECQVTIWSRKRDGQGSKEHTSPLTTSQQLRKVLSLSKR